MNAGPELDLAVAKACGLEHLWHHLRGTKEFAPSTDLNDAFEAAEKFGLFTPRGMDLGFWGNDQWAIWFLRDGDYGESYIQETHGFGATPALAICAAILKLAEKTS